MQADPLQLQVAQLDMLPTSEKIEDFLLLPIEKQEQLLQNAPAFSQKLDQIRGLNDFPLDCFQNFLSTYFSNMGCMVTNMQQTHATYPNAMRFFLAATTILIEKGVWPWTLIYEKTFLEHAQNIGLMLPQESELRQALSAIDQNAIDAFNTIVYEYSKYEHYTNVEKKHDILLTLKHKTQALADTSFPRAKAFCDFLDEKLVQTQNLSRAVNEAYLFLEEQSPPRLDQYSSTVVFQDAMRAHLALKGSFNEISLFLASSSETYWPQALFQSICLEKAQHIEKASHTALESPRFLASAWNEYYRSSDARIFRSDILFTPLQRQEIHRIIQDDIITLLFLYTVTVTENKYESMSHDRGFIPPPTAPLSLNLLEVRNRILIPLTILNHAMGLLIEKDGEKTVCLSLYQTGKGLRNKTAYNHPESADGMKYQTFLRKTNIAYNNILNQNVWKKIRSQTKAQEPDDLYRIVMEELAQGGTSAPAPTHSVDFEAPQHSGSCLYQHLQAMVRDRFMQSETLGTKEVRYVAYRMVMAEFQLFIAQKKFPDRTAIREEISCAPGDRGLLKTWEEKEKKLLAILELARSIKNEEKNPLLYIYELLTVSKNNPELVHKDAVAQKVSQAYKTYREAKRNWLMDMLKETPKELLPDEIAFNLKFTPFKSDLIALAREKLDGNEALVKQFKESLCRHRVHNVTL